MHQATSLVFPLNICSSAPGNIAAHSTITRNHPSFRELIYQPSLPLLEGLYSQWLAETRTQSLYSDVTLELWRFITSRGWGFPLWIGFLLSNPFLLLFLFFSFIKLFYLFTFQMLPSLLFLKINFQVSTHGNGVIVCCHLSADVSLYFVFPCALCPPPGWSLLAISFYLF